MSLGSDWARQCRHFRRRSLEWSQRTVRAETIEKAVFAPLNTTLSGTGRIHQLAQADGDVGAVAGKVSTEELAAIERRVKRLEKAAGDSLAKALAAGVDPKIPSHAAANLSAELVAARARRDQVAAWVAVNTMSARRARDMDRLAKEIQGVLAAPDESTARRVIDLLGVRVPVTGWRLCSHCNGKGLIAVKEPGDRAHIAGSCCSGVPPMPASPLHPRHQHHRGSPAAGGSAGIHGRYRCVECVTRSASLPRRSLITT